VARVIVEDANVGESPAFHMGEEGGDTVDEGLATDDAYVGVGPGLGHQMLSGAEADFQPELADITAKGLNEVHWALFGNIQTQTREKPVHQGLAALA